MLPPLATTPERAVFDALLYLYPGHADLLADVIREVSARMLAPLRDEVDRLQVEADEHFESTREIHRSLDRLVMAARGLR